MKLPYPSEALNTHVCILGITGAGKTVTAKGAVEWLAHEARRICVLEPTDVWYGLRLKRDGVTPGLGFVLFGGRNADIPLNPHKGAELARVIAEGNFNCVVSTKLLTPDQRATFASDFAEAMLRYNTRPLHLVIDEAHIFAPKQKRPGAKTARMLHAFNELVSSGRASGFRFMLLSQRPAKLHNDAMGQCETMIAMQLVLPHDVEAFKSWVKNVADQGEAKEILKALPMLKRGEGYVWAPRHGFLERVRFPMIRTYDSSATPDDSHTVPTVTLQELDLTAIRDALAPPKPRTAQHKPPTVKPVLGKADSGLDQPAQRKLYDAGFKAGQGTAAATAKQLDAAIRDAVVRARERFRGLELEYLTALFDDYDKRVGDLFFEYEGLAASTNKLGSKLAALRRDLAQRRKQGPADTRRLKGVVMIDASGFKPATGPLVVLPKANGDGVALNSEPHPHTYEHTQLGVVLGHGEYRIANAHKKILNALMFWKVKGFERPTKAQVAAAAGYTVSGGSYGNLLGNLRSQGLLDYPEPGLIALTPAGEVVAEPPDNEASVLGSLRTVLSPAQLRVIEKLADAGCLLTKGELAERAGFTASGGSYGNLLGSLRSLKVLDYPAPGEVQLQDWVLQ